MDINNGIMILVRLKRVDWYHWFSFIMRIQDFGNAQGLYLRLISVGKSLLAKMTKSIKKTMAWQVVNGQFEFRAFWEAWHVVCIIVYLFHYYYN